MKSFWKEKKQGRRSGFCWLPKQEIMCQNSNHMTKIDVSVMGKQCTHTHMMHSGPYFFYLPSIAWFAYFSTKPKLIDACFWISKKVSFTIQGQVWMEKIAFFRPNLRELKLSILYKPSTESFAVIFLSRSRFIASSFEFLFYFVL